MERNLRTPHREKSFQDLLDRSSLFWLMLQLEIYARGFLPYFFPLEIQVQFGNLCARPFEESFQNKCHGRL